MKKKFKIVALQVYKHTSLARYTQTGKILTGVDRLLDGEIYQNIALYILGNSNIKASEWYYNKKDQTIKKAIIVSENLIDDFDNAVENVSGNSDCCKILASTDIDITPNSIIPDSIISDYINSYFTGEMLEYVNISCDEYYDFNIGDKLKVKSDLFGVNKGDYITVKNFNNKNDNNLLGYEEDLDNSGIHVSHLEIKIKEELTTINKQVEYIKSEEKVYSKTDLTDLLIKYSHDMKIDLHKLKEWSSENL